MESRDEKHKEPEENIPDLDKLFDPDAPDDSKEVQQLFKNIVARIPKLEELLEWCNGDYEDRVYRFYHQSWKIYHIQDMTLEIIEELKALLPTHQLNEWFMKIIQEGTGKEFEWEHNSNWLPVTRPILEAFFHAKYFLEMAVKYGKELKYPTRRIGSGWAALLYLYNIR